MNHYERRHAIYKQRDKTFRIMPRSLSENSKTIADFGNARKMRNSSRFRRRFPLVFEIVKLEDPSRPNKTIW